MNLKHANLCRVLVPGVLFASVGCESTKTCDASLKLINVDVKAPDDLVIERVTADNRVLQNCESDAGDNGPWTGSAQFRCGEQGGGEYEFSVVAEDGRRWTQTIEIDDDGCHIVDYDTVAFDLTTTTPD